VTAAERFGRNVFLARRRACASQTELARVAGMHVDSIQKIEHGRRSVRLLTLLRLAEALDLDPCELLKGLRP
jgi:transcriptional regulator with XRE-family HTH domain